MNTDKTTTTASAPETRTTSEYKGHSYTVNRDTGYVEIDGKPVTVTNTSPEFWAKQYIDKTVALEASRTAKPAVKFLKKGIRDAAGVYYPCWYSLCRLIDGRTAVTVYARSLSKGLPAVLQPENDSDMMTDYFEKDRVRFYEGSAEFDALKPLARI